MQESGIWKGHTSCELCGSSDAVAVYEKEDGTIDGFCWSCTKYIKPDHISGKTINTDGDVKQRKPREPITQNQIDYIESVAGFKAKKYRCIADAVLEFTGIRTQFDDDGNVAVRYYPTHKDGVLVGYKRRFHPKDFTKGGIGQCDSKCDLLGMNVHKKGGKRVLITAGEEDYAAAVQLLRQYQVNAGRNDDDKLAVVSPLTGESGSLSQIKNNMDYLDSFDMIIVGYDNDAAGIEAAEKVAMILPEGKAFIAEWPHKDINECLKNKDLKGFINAYFKAKQFSPSEVLGSSTFDFLGAAIQRASIPRIPLPPFFNGVSELLCGGIPLGYIVNILSASGTGKSTIVNECVYHWAMHSPHMVGIVSLEATAGEYYTNLLSRHIKRKIELIKTPEEKMLFLSSDYIKEKSHELCFNEDTMGDRFVLLDDRGDIKSIQKNVENMIKVKQCKVIVIDPLQDILDEIPTEEEAKFMRWQKRMIQKHDVTFININHARKNNNTQKSNSRGGELNEEDMSGSSTIYKSGGINIVITRDKMAENPIDRNTINVGVTKARGSGLTGSAGSIYYDNKSHTLLQMTDKLREQLIANMGMVDPDIIDEERSHEIPPEFIENDIYGEYSESDIAIDSPFDI